MKAQVFRLPPGEVKSFPQLYDNNPMLIGKSTYRYNCLAWAHDKDITHWMASHAFWPDKCSKPRSDKFQELCASLKALGYMPCEGMYTPHYRTMGLYQLRGVWQHATLAMANGTWTSKLGAMEHISHRAASALEGAYYGKLTLYMRRKLCM